MSARRVMELVLGASLALTVVLPYRDDLCWIDPVTGSMKFQKQFFLVPVSTTIQHSALDRWIIRRGGSLPNRWRFLSDTSTYLFGGCGHACGLTPLTYELHAGFLNDEFVRRSSDAEIEAFLRVMNTGTDAEKKAAVESAYQLLGTGHDE